MTRRLSFCLLFLAATPTAWAQPACPVTPGLECFVEGDSIGPDNTFTTELGGQEANIDAPDFFAQPAVRITQNGTSLLEELRVAGVAIISERMFEMATVDCKCAEFCGRQDNSPCKHGCAVLFMLGKQLEKDPYISSSHCEA